MDRFTFWCFQKLIKQHHQKKVNFFLEKMQKSG